MSRNTINVIVSPETKAELANLSHDLRMHTPSDLVRAILEEQLPRYRAAVAEAREEANAINCH